jgi:hypothetical protein
MAKLLFGIAPFDPIAFIAAAGLLPLAALPEWIP